MTSITSATSSTPLYQLDSPNRVTPREQAPAAATTPPATTTPSPDGPTLLQKGLEAFSTVAFRHELATPSNAPAIAANTPSDTGLLWNSAYSTRIWTGQGWARNATAHLLAASQLAQVAAYSPPGESTSSPIPTSARTTAAI